MTVSEMLTTLGIELADPNEYQFSSTIKLNLLNLAQEEIVSELSVLGPERLWSLQYEKSFDVTSSGYALSNFGDYAMLEYGYIHSVLTTGGTPIRRITDIGILSNYFYQGTDAMPLCYLMANKYYLKVSSYPKNVTLTYLRKPKTLVASAASGYQVTTSELNPIYHPLILARAKTKAWLALNNSQQVALAKEEEKNLRASLLISKEKQPATGEEKPNDNG